MFEEERECCVCFDVTGSLGGKLAFYCYEIHVENVLMARSAGIKGKCFGFLCYPLASRTGPFNVSFGSITSFTKQLVP